MAFWIEKQYRKKNKTLFLGLSGGQGSGKTTVAGILKIILKNFFEREIYVTSIDDFYKTYNERHKISKNIHPLLKTRGVPGTHEVKLVKKFLKHWSPNIAIFVDSEVWPNLILNIKENKIPIVLVNGRITKKS